MSSVIAAVETAARLPDSPLARSSAGSDRRTTERPAVEQQPTESATADAVESALERNGRDITFGGRSIRFDYDREINRVVVKVVAEDSGDVVRQIPPDEYLKFASQFRELIGVLFDGTV